jgi:hypothetical protein
VGVSFSALLPAGIKIFDSKVEEADSCGVNLQKDLQARRLDAEDVL